MLSRSKYILQPAKRFYSSVPLSFNKYSVKPSSEPPVLICHGLFGSKQNWSSLAKAMSNRLSRTVYTIDLRNHGDSPHTNIHTYETMSNDLVEFMSEHDIQKPVLLGHSMGGKTVMTTALQHPSLVSKLIVIDMPPVAMRLSADFARYVDAMRAIDQSNPKKQSEADKILSQYESDLGVRMFLLTNLKRDAATGEFRFRVPYETLGRSLQTMGGFIEKTTPFDHPTLFIAGGNSPYYKPFQNQKKEIDALFPNSDLQVVEGAGHWVHAEKPDIVLNLITSFVNNS
ncbi:Alpha/Beta hydrolase protein [Helicostylum pulchrum]|nr:Alpha/Beta hydrolase protein [Helicostylum pulchrum]